MQNIETVREGVAESPGTSIQHRDQEVNTLRCSLQRVPKKDLLHLHAFKAPLTQELKPSDLT